MTAAPPSRREVLDRTARSFALSVRLLPEGLRPPVELAYLLARAADTLADRPWAGGPDPGPPLAAFRAALRRDAPPGDAPRRDGAPPSGAFPAGPAPDDPTSRAEAALLAAVPALLADLRGLEPADRDDVVEVVGTLVATMEDEVARFRGPGLAALPDPAALVRYTEGIAGCVGVFWTRLAARHVGALGAGEAALARAGRRYGRGLQLVNVLRDLPRDLARGRCLLPASELAAAGLAPEDLLRAGDARVARAVAPVLARWEARARAGLLAGTWYAARLPARAWRTRVATALPAALGLATLARLAAQPRRLDPAVVVRVTRPELARLARRTAFWCAFPRGPLRLARTGLSSAHGHVLPGRASTREPVSR